MADKPQEHSLSTRRAFVKGSAAAAAGLVLGGCSDRRQAEERETERSQRETVESGVESAETQRDSVEGDSPASSEPQAAVRLEPTPACDDHDETPSQAAGPFYTPDTPERSNLREPGTSGQHLRVSGRVLDPDCQPIAGAMLDFWHADEAGAYDNEGFRYRGHLFADADGRFELLTIAPGLYTGRTQHIHVRVQGRDTALLTTQLYFPDSPLNGSDGGFDERLLLSMSRADAELEGRFDFVLPRLS